MIMMATNAIPRATCGKSSHRTYSRYKLARTAGATRKRGYDTQSRMTFLPARLVRGYHTFLYWDGGGFNGTPNEVAEILTRGNSRLDSIDWNQEISLTSGFAVIPYSQRRLYGMTPICAAWWWGANTTSTDRYIDWLMIRVMNPFGRWVNTNVFVADFAVREDDSLSEDSPKIPVAESSMSNIEYRGDMPLAPGQTYTLEPPELPTEWPAEFPVRETGRALWIEPVIETP